MALQILSRASTLGCSLLLVALVSCLNVAHAVEPPPTYLLQPGDAINIQVLEHDEWTTTTPIIVRPDGNISFAGVADVKVGGLTVPQATERIVNVLDREGHHIHNPQVVLNATTLSPQVIYVLGAVTKPGVAPVVTGIETASRVLSLAGGVTPTANLHQVALFGDDSHKTICDLQMVLDGKSPDPIMHAGDVMYVPELKPLLIGVLGAVTKPGPVTLDPDKTSMDLIDVMVQAQGPLATADLKRGLVLRANGKIESLVLDKVLRRETPPVILNAGDTLWVLPQLPEYFAVAGAVKTPGRFDYQDGVNLGEALALGGLAADTIDVLHTADIAHVSVLHADGSSQVYDVRALLAGKDATVGHTPIQPGDIVIVPPVAQTVAVLGSVAKPGFLPWQPYLRLTDALAEAGGAVEHLADLAHVSVVRRTGDGAAPVVLTLNVQKLLLGKNEPANLVLAPGDTIYVPAVPDKSWEDAVTPLTILGLAGTLYDVFRR